MKQLRATGLYTPKGGLMVSFRDDSLIVPRLRSVKVSWPMVAECYRGILDQCERVFVAEIERRIGESDPWLPLEKWE